MARECIQTLTAERDAAISQRNALERSCAHATQLVSQRDAALDEARADVERTIAARNTAISERDEYKRSWLSASEHETRLVSQRDAALAEVERHRMTEEEREAVVNGLYCLAGYLDRTKEGQ